MPQRTSPSEPDLSSSLLSLNRIILICFTLLLGAILIPGVLVAFGVTNAAAMTARGEKSRAQTIQVPTWEPDTRANSDSTETSQHEPSLAISRTDPDVVVVVAKDYRINNNKEVWIYVSQDGGQTWPEELQRQIPGMPADIPNQSDPVALARDDGRIYVFALGHNDGHGLFVTWTDDDGLTWQDPSITITYNETPYGLDDKEWPAIDNNPASPYYHNMYVAWATGGIQFKRSTDGGLTWSSPYQTIAPGNTEYPYPVVGADGTLYVFYMDGWGYCADGWIRYVKSTDGGISFTGPYDVVATSQPCSPIHGSGGYDQYRFFSIITAAADPNNPLNLWAAWTDDNDITYGKTDVLYVRSTDGGITWSNPARLSHDDPDAYIDHITPVFAMGADSTLHAFWLDKRDDPQNRLYHGYHTATSDGVTWERDTRVSDEAFDLNLYFPPPFGYNAAGDYWGLDVVGNIVMAAWNTTVETSQDIYVSRGIYTSPYTVTLTGIVEDAWSLSPLERAEVTVENGLGTTTNPTGAYTLTLTSGIYTVTAQAQGYFPQTFSYVDVLTGTVVQDFSLEPLPPVLTGQVTDANSAEPLPGVQVMVDNGLYTYTNASGIYSLTLAAGVYTVTAELAGYFPHSIPQVELVSGTLELDIALQPLPVLNGVVTDLITSLPISGAQVIASSTAFTSTGIGGVYLLALEPGTYTVTAQASGYYSQTVANLEIVSGTLAQDFALMPLVCPAPQILEVSIVPDNLQVGFSATISSTNPVTTLWNFGDGFTSTLLTPQHNYADYGTYTIILQAQNICGSDTWQGELSLAPPQPQYNSYLPLMRRAGG